MPDPLFQDADVIFRYDDRQAVADGVLITLTDRDRVTQTMWGYLQDHLPTDEPPCNWPVALFGWARATTPAERARAAIEGLIATYRSTVERLDMGPLALWMDVAPGPNGRTVIRAIDAAEKPSTAPTTPLWLVQNEMGGRDCHGAQRLVT